MKIGLFYFLSFADKRFYSQNRIKKEASLSRFFDYIIVGDENMFERWYKKKYRDRFTDRGFGFWQWKSYLIRRTFDIMEEGDILVYADAGCKINPEGRKRMFEYFDIVSKSESGVLVFNQGYREAEWTKADVFEYFGVMTSPRYLNHGQVAGGIIISQKKQNSAQLFNEWFYICHNHYDLISDSPSIIPNDNNFKEHRHDQSVFSILANKYNAVELSVEEIFTEGEWNIDLKDFPIWACRLRQKRTSALKKIASRISAK